jgi:outer membrane protein OmpA-like peptidoglycan-associated protein
VARDPQKLSRALQEVISPAISQGIADNKEKMIDALYPIMGGMISKYVTQAIKEMMETINKKIEQGFSIERYKRKLKAKLSGVSESELLLEESTDAHIAAMFVIHKESGLLVSEAHLENSHVGDPHMVASMASAIKDFINDWIADNQSETNEIQILSYGNATLYIESAGSVYIIAFLDSEPDYEQRAQINAFFASLLKSYADFFQNFDGDDSKKEVAELSDKMYAYLSAQSNLGEKDISVQTKRNPAKFIFAALGVALLVYAGFRLKNSYDVHTLQEEIAQKTGEEVTLVKEGDRYLLKGALNDPAHLRTIMQITQQNRLGEQIQPHLYLSLEGIAKSEQQLLSRISQTQQKRLEEQQALFAKELEKMKQDTEAKYETLLKREKQIEQKLAAMSGKSAALQRLLGLKRQISSSLAEAMHGEPYYDPEKEILNFASLHLFEEGKPEPVKEKLEILKRVFEKYVKALLPYKPYIGQITVSSFSDTTGDAQSNLALTQARARKVLAYLRTTPFVKENALGNLMKASGKGESNPIIVNGEEDHAASRRIVIGYTLNQKKIDQAIEELLH